METHVNPSAESIPVLDTKVSDNTISSKLKKVFNRNKQANSQNNLSNKKVRVFLVDDDPLFLKALELSITSNIGPITINTFQTGEACLQNMRLKPSIVILDYFLNSEVPYAWNGMNILQQIKKISPRTKVIMLSSQDSLNIAIDCMEKGAYDYVSKSRSSLIRINNLLKNILGNINVNSTFFDAVHFILLIIILVLIASLITSYFPIV